MCCPRRPWSPSSQLVPKALMLQTPSFTNEQPEFSSLHTGSSVCSSLSILLQTMWQLQSCVWTCTWTCLLASLPPLGEQSSHLTTHPLTVNSLWLATEALQSPRINIWEQLADTRLEDFQVCPNSTLSFLVESLQRGVPTVGQDERPSTHSESSGSQKV